MAVLLCFRLRLDLNFLSLLPPNNTQVRTFFEVTEKVGLQSILISSVDLPREMPAQIREAVVQLIAHRYAQSTLIDEVDFRRDQFDLNRILPVLLRYLPHLLKPDEVDRLHRLVTDEEIHRRVRSNKKLLLTPFGFAAKEMVVMDPLGLGTLLQESLAIPSKSLVQKGHHGFYSTGDGNYLIFLKPRRPPQDIRFSKRLMAAMQVMEAEALQAAHQQLGPFSAQPTISHTGGYPIAVNDEVTTKKDIKVSLVTSIIGVLTLFGVCFRTMRTLVHVTIPLGMGIVWTLGLAGLLFGRLNLLTCIFSCVLIGLGIDFAIHFINRFYSTAKISQSLEHRLAATYRETGAGIIIGALTTAAAFMSIGISDFKGFRELGVMTGADILLCLAAMLLVLPALLIRSQATAKGRAVQVAGFGLPRVIDLLGRHPSPTLAGIVVVTVLMMMTGTRVGFDDNLKNFRPSDDQILKLQDQVTQWLGGSSASTLWSFPDPVSMRS
jgi:predicted exporter